MLKSVAKMLYKIKFPVEIHCFEVEDNVLSDSDGRTQ